MLKLIIETTNYRTANQNSKAPRDVFTQCIACGCKELLYVDRDVICMKCDWNSLKADVEAGGFEGKTHRFPGSKGIKIKIQKQEIATKTEESESA